MGQLSTTPLTGWHTNNGGKLVDFAGWEMPVQYEGILGEHKHTRSKASLFDICHMGEFHVTGAGATQALATIVTHNLDNLSPGQCRYGFILNQLGGILDDLIIYKLDEDEFMIVVNGACTESDYEWFISHLPGSVTITDRSARTGKIDLQGPKSMEVLASIIPGPWKELGYFRFTTCTLDGTSILISRTGYTGELGYELYMDADQALSVWERFIDHPDVKPAGLGARDTLRLEVGLPLYGQDLDTEHTPAEAGCGFFLKSEAEYIGKSYQNTISERIVPLAIPGRRSARHGDDVFLPDGTRVGRVTSGSFAPSLGHCIALAYVRAEQSAATDFEIRGRAVLKAHKVSLPFYTQGTARKKL
ncbi:glycine cleavage system aminomethyltransferase GcvT [Desulfoplanes sp.]